MQRKSEGFDIYSKGSSVGTKFTVQDLQHVSRKTSWMVALPKGTTHWLLKLTAKSFLMKNQTTSVYMYLDQTFRVWMKVSLYIATPTKWCKFIWQVLDLIIDMVKMSLSSHELLTILEATRVKPICIRKAVHYLRGMWHKVFQNVSYFLLHREMHTPKINLDKR